MDRLGYIALFIGIMILVALVYVIIAIHDIPYNIAKKRNHPHAGAIHAAGWVSLFTLHAIWPFLWIWATAYDPVGGYAGKTADDVSGSQNSESQNSESHDAESGDAELCEKISQLTARVAELEKLALDPPAVNEEEEA